MSGRPHAQAGAHEHWWWHRRQDQNSEQGCLPGKGYGYYTSWGGGKHAIKNNCSHS
jgi:hypothetical protein